VCGSSCGLVPEGWPDVFVSAVEQVCEGSRVRDPLDDLLGVTVLLLAPGVL